MQVKGAANKPEERWWVQYGYNNEEIIGGKAPMFNRRSSFYRANVVVLVAVRSLKQYQCVVFPIKAAEAAAQLNMDHGYRTAKIADGGKKKPGKVWVHIDEYIKGWKGDVTAARLKRELLAKEKRLIKKYLDGWDKCFGIETKMSQPD